MAGEPRETAPKSMLYTRSGDAGTTALFGVGRVPKDHPRVEASGAIDELNSVLGVTVSFLDDLAVTETLSGIQNELFNLGSELASETGGKAANLGRQFAGADARIAALERLTDEYDSQLPPLRTFVLPSGSRAGAFLHLARTVCRRAERDVVRLSHQEQVNPDILRYLNRLSDLLFVLARYINVREGKSEREWRKGE